MPKVNPHSLYRHLNKRRHRLGALAGNGDPLPWTEVADQVGIHSAAFSRMRLGKALSDESLAKVLAWADKTESDFEILSVIGDTDLPIAGSDVEWDGDGATDRVFELYTGEDGEVDVEGVARAFLFRDDEADPATRAAYSLGFADVIDGELTIIPRGVSAAAGRLDQTDISDEDREAVANRICSIYASIQEADDEWPDCPLEEEPESEPEQEDPTEDNSVGGCETCGDHATAVDDEPEVEPDNRTAAIFGWGRLSESEDPDTQALVTRARELMIEGAAGVSIRHDLDPADMPSPEQIKELEEAERWEELEKLLSQVHARPRHVALVDTAAFSDARLAYDEETGEVSGPVTFEGHWTGDIRRLPYGVLQWDDDLLPIPITMGHEGPGGTQPPIIGYIDKLERQDGVTSAMRIAPITESEVGAVVAAAGVKAGLPHVYFDKFKASQPQPVRVSAPDSIGLRRIWGTAAPKGVCHRSDMGACFQFPGDVDPHLRGFHTGAAVQLDNGSEVRVGAITFGGLHIDTALARRGVGVREANRHREDGRQVLAMVRAWPAAHGGLDFSGVIAAQVDENQLLQALACSPSVELWPAGHGRTTTGIHIVPTPAWPVVAAAGDAMEMTSTLSVEIEDGEALQRELEAEEAIVDLTNLEFVVESLSRIEKAMAMIVADKLADVPVPDDE